MTDKLAIRGGAPAAELLKGSEYVWPKLHKEDEESVLNALRQGHWGGFITDDIHPQLAFERKFADYHDSSYGVLVANGTISLELSLRAGGVQPGDEVIVPAITFFASATAIVSVGAVPVFADVDPATCQISAAAIEAAITPRTKAVIVVHFGGYPADMDAILAAARKHGIFVVEDCAHAQGAAWRGQRIGSLGEFGSFSFQQSKSLSGGEGGIVLTRDKEAYDKACLIRNIGRVPGDPTYFHHISASNWRLGGLQSALLLSQFSKFPEQAVVRDKNYRALTAALNEVEGITSLPADERITQYGCYFAVFDFDEEAFGCSRKQFVQAMRAEGVQWCTTGYNRSVYQELAFREDRLRPLLHANVPLPDYAALRMPNADRWAERMVTILHFYLLDDGTAVELIANAVRKIKEHAAELAPAGEGV